LFLAVSYQSLAGAPEPEQGAGVFALVNISVPEEPVPAAPPPPAPKLPLPEPFPVSVDAPAENFMVTAEETAAAQEAPQETGPPVQAANAGPGGRAAETSGRTAEAAALTAEYIKRNYNYIQRRIKDRLVYPSPARRAGIQGVTEVSFIIHEDGRVSAVTVRTGSGHAVLDEAAVATIHAAAPFPAPPAAARIAIPISFRLR
ncbi:MAG: TonB family protein, partial [Treponema sp.]|nr:TonB family protein [Treponema sp.]